MLLAALVAVLALALPVLATRPGGRTETALALPLVAVLAVRSPPALLALLGGAVVAGATLVALEARTLLYGRRLRAAAAVAGATVPLGTVAAGAWLGATPPLPEVWVAGSVAPGALVYEWRRRATNGIDAVAVLGVGALAALVAGAVLARLVWFGSPADWWWIGPESAGAGLAPSVAAPLVLVGLALGVLARWRYGLHAGPLSAPLLAVWTLVWPAALAAYVVAGVAVWLALPALAERRSGRRLAAVCGVAGVVAATGVLWAAGVATAGTAGVAAVLAAALAAEDARLLRSHAGADRGHAVLLGATLYAWLLVAAAYASARGLGATGRPVVVAAGLAALAAAVAIGLRERARPSERRLRASERRWTP